MTTELARGSIPDWTLQDRLRKAREHAGLSQTELAEATGISRRSISNYEVGVQTPRRPGLLAWAMACGVPLGWLQDGRESEPPTSGYSLPAGSWFESKRGSQKLLRVA